MRSLRSPPARFNKQCLAFSFKYSDDVLDQKRQKAHDHHHTLGKYNDPDML